MRTEHRERKCRWFAAWMLPGACLAFGVTAVALFAVPIGLVLVVGLHSRRPGIDALGLLADVGVVVAWIGSVNLDYNACAPTSVGLSVARGAAASRVYSCGGVNGVPWMIVGGAAVAVSVILYLFATRQPPHVEGWAL